MENKTDDELIAEFLGWTKCLCGLPKEVHYKYGEKIWEVCALKDFKFKTHWDNWLMPVIIKCNLQCAKTGYPDHLSFHHLRLSSTPVAVAYESVVEIIKWFNYNKQN